MNILLGNQGNKLQIIDSINTLQKYKFEAVREIFKEEGNDYIYQHYNMVIYIYTPWKVKIFVCTFASTALSPENGYLYSSHGKDLIYFRGDTIYFRDDPYQRICVKLNYDCKDMFEQIIDKLFHMIKRDVTISKKFISDINKVGYYDIY